MNTIYLAGGCFWCTEAIFKSLKGVSEVVPGYMGGNVPKPTYEQVCSGETGHAEVIKVIYDESIINLSDLFEIFFDSHNPTTLNRQGEDVGTQYRSAIFYTTQEQRDTALEAIKKAQKDHDREVVTEVVPASEFYEAEDYHKEYYLKHSNQPYCAVVISPKLEKLQKNFSDKIISS